MLPYAPLRTDAQVGTGRRETGHLACRTVTDNEIPYLGWQTRQHGRRRLDKIPICSATLRDAVACVHCISAYG